MPGLRLAPDGDPLRIGPDGGRLEAVLVGHARAARGTAPGSPRLLGTAWRDAAGSTRFAWPEGPLLVAGLESGLAARRAVLLPGALGLVAALRRAEPGPGTRCRILGGGIAAALARSVAADFGMREIPPGENRDAARPALVIVTDPSGGDLEEGLRGLEDGGRLVAFGEPRDLPAIDFYPDVHRRGLSLDIDPWLVDAAAAAALWRRGQGRLERLCAAVETAPGDEIPLLVDGAGFRVAAASGWSIQTAPA